MSRLAADHALVSIISCSLAALDVCSSPCLPHPHPAGRYDPLATYYARRLVFSKRAGLWSLTSQPAQCLVSHHGDQQLRTAANHVRPENEADLPASLPYIALYQDTICGQVVHPVFFRILQT
jgi:hypothetical protein